MGTHLNPFLSQKFRFWSFVSMFLLVFVHGYNVEPRYLQPWTTPTDALTPTAFVQYLLANGLLRFRIPMEGRECTTQLTPRRTSRRRAAPPHPHGG